MFDDLTLCRWVPNQFGATPEFVNKLLISRHSSAVLVGDGTGARLIHSGRAFVNVVQKNPVLGQLYYSPVPGTFQ